MAKSKKKSKPAPSLDHIIEALRPLAVECSSLALDPANARKHNPKNLKAIQGSLRSFGQRKPIVVNRRTGTVEAGNGSVSGPMLSNGPRLRRCGIANRVDRRQNARKVPIPEKLP
jgi:hypothetical protein